MSRIEKDDQFRTQRDAWLQCVDSVLSMDRFGLMDGTPLGHSSDGYVDLVELEGVRFTKRQKAEDEACRDPDFGSRHWLGSVGYDPKSSVDNCRPVYLTSEGHELMRVMRKRRGVTDRIRHGTISQKEALEVLMSVYPEEHVARKAQANELDSLFESLFAGNIPLGPGDAQPVYDPYDMSHLFADTEHIGRVPGSMSIPSVAAKFLCHGAPILHTGQSCRERWQCGDGQKYFPGRLTQWVLYFIGLSVNDELQCQLSSLIVATVIEAVSGIATDVDASMTWRQSLTSIRARMLDPTLRAYLPVRIRPSVARDLGRAVVEGDGSALLYTGAGCPPLYAREDLLGPREVRPTPGQKDDIIAKLRALGTRKSLDDVDQVQRDFFNRVTPFIESDKGVEMTPGTRTNMTFERCGWFLGIMHSLVAYQTVLSDHQDVFNAHTMFMEMIDTGYGIGASILKKVKGALEGAVTTTRTPRLCMDSAGPFVTTLGVERVRYSRGVLMRQEQEQTISWCTPSSESYFMGYVLLAGKHDTEASRLVDCARRRRERLDALTNLGQHHLRSFLELENLSQRMAAFLYEPVSVFGYTYSYHGLVVMATLRPSDYVDPEDEVPQAEVVDDLRRYIREAFERRSDKDGVEMNTTLDCLRRVVKYMTTAKSSGYSVKMHLGADITAKLDHKGRGGAHKNEVDVRSTSKAMSEAYSMLHMLSATFMYWVGTAALAMSGGTRHVPGFRYSRLMYMLHSALQIVIQVLYVCLASTSKCKFTTSVGVIDPDSYSSLRGDGTDLQKLWMVHVMSSRSSLYGDYVMLSLDYSSMDQHTGLLVRLWIEELLKLGGPTMQYPISPQDTLIGIQHCTNIPGLVSASSPEGVAETMGMYLARGIHHATNAWFQSTTLKPGKLGATKKIKLRVGGVTYVVRVPSLGLSPVCRTSFNTSGNNTTALMNNAGNAVVLVEDCIFFGDDAVKFFRLDDFAAKFSRDLLRARQTKQDLDGEDCPVGTTATYLKNNVYGLQSLKRQRCLSKENPAPSFTPLSAKAELTSLYEMCVRSGDEVGFLTLAPFFLASGKTFKGYGFKVDMPPGWFCVGGDLPNLIGPRPFNVSPFVLDHMSGHLTPWLTYLGVKPMLHEGKPTMFAPDTVFKDEAAIAFSNYVVGIEVSNPPVEYTNFSVSVRGIKGIEEKIELTGAEAVARAKTSFTSILDPVKSANSTAVLRRMKTEKSLAVDGSLVSRYSSATMDYVNELAYTSDVARQAAGVFSEAISFTSKTAAIAEKLSTGLKLKAVVRMKPKCPPPATMFHDLGVCSVAHTLAGTFSLTRTTSRSEFACSVKLTDGTSYSYPFFRLFDLSHGTLELALVAMFGIDTDPDDAKMSAVMLYERPNLTYLQVLRVISICDGDLPSAATILGVSLEQLTTRFSDSSIRSLRAVEALLGCGSCRMTGVTGNLAYNEVRNFAILETFHDPSNRVRSAVYEYALSFHTSMWLLLMNSMPNFGIEQNLKLPLYRVSVTGISH